MALAAPLLLRVVEMHNLSGRFGQSARYYKELAEMYEQANSQNPYTQCCLVSVKATPNDVVASGTMQYAVRQPLARLATDPHSYHSH